MNPTDANYMVDSADGWKFFVSYGDALDYATARAGEWRIVDFSAKKDKRIRAEGVGTKTTYVRLDVLEDAFARAFGL